MSHHPHSLISQSAAAREYGISEDEIAAARETGKLPYRRSGTAVNSTIQMRRVDVERYIEMTLIGDPLPAPVVRETEEEEDPNWVRNMIRKQIPNYGRPS